MPQYFDQNGKRIGIGRLLGRGGEATAYEVDSDPSLVIKVYHEPAEAQKSQKLEVMVRLSHPDITKFAAWPQAIVKQSAIGPVLGIVMPKAYGEEIHTLYSPTSRKTSFPSADWRFLIRTATNFASAVATLHKHGIVIGDINQGNVLVGDDAIVRFIDCDSFQIRGGNRTFRCTVGVPHFTPPELQSCRFADIDRVENHDRFGLAVMIFHLLFAGRHPFVGRYFGPGEFSIESAIQQFRFAYSANHTQLQIDPPPHALLLSDISQGLAKLFEEAFDRKGISNHRPSADSWRDSLREFEGAMLQCNDDPGHFYFANTRCPWCRIANAGGPNLFLTVSLSWFKKHKSEFDVEKIWKIIAAVPKSINGLIRIDNKKLVASVPKPNISNNKNSSELLLVLKIIIGISACLGILGLVVQVYAMSVVFGGSFLVSIGAFLFVNAAYFRDRLKYIRDRGVEEARIQRFKSKLHNLVTDADNEITRYRNLLYTLKINYQSIDSEKAKAINALSSNAEQKQKDAFLSSVLLRSAAIPGIGPTRVYTLEYYGIETAFDIDPRIIEQIPGFGEQLTARLVAWRYSVERQFRFDKSKGLPLRDLQAVDLKFEQQKLHLQKSLMDGERKLKALFDERLRDTQRFINDKGFG
jgi:DNA-binding helix-hairpin-helix protein with protein kinase domain